AAGAGGRVDDDEFRGLRHRLEPRVEARYRRDRGEFRGPLLEPAQGRSLWIVVDQRRGIAFGGEIRGQARGDRALAATTLGVGDEDMTHGLSRGGIRLLSWRFLLGDLFFRDSSCRRT